MARGEHWSKRIGLSEQAYAERAGMSKQSVKVHKRAQRVITFPDGSIDAEATDRMIAANTLPTTLRRGKGARTPKGDAASFLAARAENEVIKMKVAKINLAILRGEYLSARHVRETVFKIARQERDAWQNWPARVAPLMAAALGCDDAALYNALASAVRLHLSELSLMTIDDTPHGTPERSGRTLPRG